MERKVTIALAVVSLVGLWLFNGQSDELDNQEIYSKVQEKLRECQGDSQYSLQLLSRGISGDDIVISAFTFVKKMTIQQGRQFNFTLPNNLVIGNLEVLDPVLVHMAQIEAVNETRNYSHEIDIPDLTEQEKELFKKCLSDSFIESYYKKFYQQDLETVLSLIGIIGV